jgi:hypothetical protein
LLLTGEEEDEVTEESIDNSSELVEDNESVGDLSHLRMDESNPNLDYIMPENIDSVGELEQIRNKNDIFHDIFGRSYVTYSRNRFQ